MNQVEAKVKAVIGRLDKFAVEMDVVRHVAPTPEFPIARQYVCATVTSGFVFTDSDAAWLGGLRAVKQFNDTERFPNMCQPF